MVRNEIEGSPKFISLVLILLQYEIILPVNVLHRQDRRQHSTTAD